MEGAYIPSASSARERFTSGGKNNGIHPLKTSAALLSLHNEVVIDPCGRHERRRERAARKDG